MATASDDDPASRGTGSDDLTHKVSELGQQVQHLQAQLVRAVRQRGNTGPAVLEKKEGKDAEDPFAPAAWVWFRPPIAAEAHPGPGHDARVTVANFVTWYNDTFVGVDGGRAKPIPPCWAQHPGLAAEIATLTYSWRAAHIGPTASVRDAQQWLHQWRIGFADRLVRDWVPSDCHDGLHRAAGAPARVDRFTDAEHSKGTRHAPPPNGPPVTQPPVPGSPSRGSAS